MAQVNIRGIWRRIKKSPPLTVNLILRGQVPENDGASRHGVEHKVGGGMEAHPLDSSLLVREGALGIGDGTRQSLLGDVPQLDLAVQRTGGQESVVERGELEVCHGVRVRVQQRHRLALASAVVEGENGDTRPRVLPVEGHEGGGGGDVVAVVLIRADDNVPHAHLRLGHDGRGILVLGRLESPRHCFKSSLLSGLICRMHWSVGSGGGEVTHASLSLSGRRMEILKRGRKREKGRLRLE